MVSYVQKSIYNISHNSILRVLRLCLFLEAGTSIAAYVAYSRKYVLTSEIIQQKDCPFGTDIKGNKKVFIHKIVILKRHFKKAE